MHIESGVFMKILLFALFSIHLLTSTLVTKASASPNRDNTNAVLTSTQIQESVKKIKEDDEGKIIILNNNQIVYLKYSHPKFDDVFEMINQSLIEELKISITVDAKFQIISTKINE